MRTRSRATQLFSVRARVRSSRICSERPKVPRRASLSAWVLFCSASPWACRRFFSSWWLPPSATRRSTASAPVSPPGAAGSCLDMSDFLWCLGSPAVADQFEHQPGFGLLLQPAPDALHLVDALGAMALAHLRVAPLLRLGLTQLALPHVGQHGVEPGLLELQGRPLATIKPHRMAMHAAVDTDVGLAAGAQALHEALAGRAGPRRRVGLGQPVFGQLGGIGQRRAAVDPFPVVVQANPVAVACHAFARGQARRERLFAQGRAVVAGAAAPGVGHGDVSVEKDQPLSRPFIRVRSALFRASLPSRMTLVSRPATVRFCTSSDELPSAPSRLCRSGTTSRSPESWSLNATCSVLLLFTTPSMPLPTASAPTKRSK